MATDANGAKHDHKGRFTGKPKHGGIGDLLAGLGITDVDRSVDSWLSDATIEQGAPEDGDNALLAALLTYDPMDENDTYLSERAGDRFMSAHRHHAIHVADRQALEAQAADYISRTALAPDREYRRLGIAPPRIA